jgi:hypothetical protein
LPHFSHLSKSGKFLLKKYNLHWQNKAFPTFSQSKCCKIAKNCHKIDLVYTALILSFIHGWHFCFHKLI